MFAGADNRRVAMALVIAIALVTIAIPTIAMIGCEMDMGKGMPYMPSGVGIFNVCPGDWVTSTGPVAVVPTSTTSILLVLSAIVLAAAVLLAPREPVSVVVSERDEPPPPPEDPLGQRFRI